MKTLRRITKNRAFTHLRILAAVLLVLTAAALVFVTVSPPAAAQPNAGTRPVIPRLTPKFLKPVAFDVSPALRNLPQGRETFALPTRHNIGGATGAARIRRSTGPPSPALPCRWCTSAVQPDSDHPRSVAYFRGNVEPGQFQHLRLPG